MKVLKRFSLPIFLFTIVAIATFIAGRPVSSRTEPVVAPDSLSATNSIYVRSEKFFTRDAYPPPGTPEPFDPADDDMGWSVGISGNTAIVGLPMDDTIAFNDRQGSAYVYERKGETWVFLQKLISRDPNDPTYDGDPNDNFGTSVAINGDTIVVGAPMNGSGRGGAAFVYARNCPGGVCSWNIQAKLLNTFDEDTDPPGDNNANGRFGESVDIDGNRIIVGAVSDSTINASQSGSATIFQRIGSLWSREEKLRILVGTAFFGSGVGISGTRAIVGASNHNRAYIFDGPGWTQQHEFVGGSGASFGDSVAVDGNTAVIGSVFSPGQAVVSERNGGVWTTPTPLPNTQTTQDVDIDGETIVTGSPISSNFGRAHVYKRINGNWTYKVQLFQTGYGSYQDFFGKGVGVNGNNIIVGAFGDANYQGGRAYQGTASIFTNVRSRPFDFDGDKGSNVSIFRPSNSGWFVLGCQTSTVERHLALSCPTFTSSAFGSSGDKIAPGDFDGDGKADIAVFRPSTGTWYILNSSTSQTSVIGWGTSGDIPIPNDFDNDGKADVTVFRPSNSTWYWINSSDQQNNAAQFGQSGDVPIMADFDGDGRGELAFFRSSAGTWHWYNLTTQQTATPVQWGISGDIPTTGDFDGDLKTDISLFRPSNSTWYRINSSNSQPVITTYGSSGDVPVAADYDTDGETDIAVFRPSTNAWYIQNSSSLPGSAQYPIQNTIVTFGSSGDKPVPTAFLP